MGFAIDFSLFNQIPHGLSGRLPSVFNRSHMDIQIETYFQECSTNLKQSVVCLVVRGLEMLLEPTRACSR